MSLEGVWNVSGGCLECVWKVSGMCLEGVWSVSGSQKIVEVKIFFEGQKTFGGHLLGVRLFCGQYFWEVKIN